MKKSINDALEKNDFKGILAQARQDKKVVSLLVRCAYVKDTLLGQRAIRAMGLVAKELVRKEPEVLRDRVRKLL